MLNRNYVKDERISQMKRKISNEAFGLMFFALTAIVFVKSVVLGLDTKVFITEFVLWLGVAVYVFVRMLMTGIYAQNIRNASKGGRLLSDAVFTAVMGVLLYADGELNIWVLAAFAVVYFAAFYGILKLADWISERRINQ
jgi:hypothetical protein